MGGADLLASDHRQPVEVPVIPLDRIQPYEADRSKQSPNHSARPASVKAVTVVVLHATAGSDLGAETWMANPLSRVSAHLHIRRDGSVTRLVDDRRRAWHAGASEWLDVRNVNDFSLGWELGNANDGRESYTDAQYRTVAAVAAHYMRQGMPIEAFTSHAVVATPPGRKTDPFAFDWGRFRKEATALAAPDDNMGPLAKLLTSERWRLRNDVAAGELVDAARVLATLLEGPAARGDTEATVLLRSMVEVQRFYRGG